METEMQIKRPRDSFDPSRDKEDLGIYRQKVSVGNEVKKQKLSRPSATVLANGILQSLLGPELEIPNGDGERNRKCVYIDVDESDNDTGSGGPKPGPGVDLATQASKTRNIGGNFKRYLPKMTPVCSEKNGDVSVGINHESKNKTTFEKKREDANDRIGYSQKTKPFSKRSGDNGNRMEGTSQVPQNISVTKVYDMSMQNKNGSTNRNQIQMVRNNNLPDTSIVRNESSNHSCKSTSINYFNRDKEGYHVNNRKESPLKPTTTTTTILQSKPVVNSQYAHRPSVKPLSKMSGHNGNRMEGTSSVPQNNGVTKVYDMSIHNKNGSTNRSHMGTGSHLSYTSIVRNESIIGSHKSTSINYLNRDKEGCHVNSGKESPLRTTTSTTTTIHQRKPVVNSQNRHCPSVSLVTNEKKYQNTSNSMRSFGNGEKHQNESTGNDIGMHRKSIHVSNNSNIKISTNENQNGDKTTKGGSNLPSHSNGVNNGSKKSKIEIICIDDSDSDEEISTKKVAENKKKTSSNMDQKQNPTMKSVKSVSVSQPIVRENIMERRKIGSIRAVTLSEKENILRLNLSKKKELIMKHVKRVNVNEPNVREHVTECRQSGVPIVLIGHKGWVNFARPWLTELRRDGQSIPASRSSLKNIDIDLKSAIYRYEVNVDKMINHIGMEEVPILRKNYNERNPISHKAKASFFLKKHWSSDSNESVSDFFYLHQWQFPLSETAGPKLCAQCKPLPSGIFGEDILRYYLGEEMPHCPWDNPFQYIFMGTGGTKSKLHADAGGLDITIAVITGEKECILVHRDDGDDCFYDLDASLDEVDLNEYPLMSQARIWKTTIKPGDILLMPQGTFHQCRNTAPCLSYSRFILDTVNLLPFYRSFQNGDAKEIPHEEILWNCAIELVKKIDKYTDEFQLCLKKKIPCPALDDGIILAVEALQSLRHFFRDIARKGAAVYAKIVEDIDDTLQTFEYRKIPKFPRHRDM